MTMSVMKKGAMFGAAAAVATGMAKPTAGPGTIFVAVPAVAGGISAIEGSSKDRCLGALSGAAGGVAVGAALVGTSTAAIAVGTVAFKAITAVTATVVGAAAAPYVVAGGGAVGLCVLLNRR